MNNTHPMEIIYLHVPYSEKDRAKKIGAGWNPSRKQWFCLNRDIDKFTRWVNKPEKIWLRVKYEERVEAKRLGARWDGEEKEWYCYADKLEAIDKFDPAGD